MGHDNTQHIPTHRDRVAKRRLNSKLLKVISGKTVVKIILLCGNYAKFHVVCTASYVSEHEQNLKVISEHGILSNLRHAILPTGTILI